MRKAVYAVSTLAGSNFVECIVRRLWCVVGRHDLVLLAHEGAALLVCRRCSLRRVVPVVGDARQASIGEAVEKLKAAGVVLIDRAVLDELELAWRVEKAFAQVDEPW